MPHLFRISGTDFALPPVETAGPPGAYTSLNTVADLGAYNTLLNVQTSRNYIYISLFKPVAVQTLFASRLKSGGTWQYHTVPLNSQSVSGLLVIDDTTVYYGLAIGGNSRVIRFTRGTPDVHTDLAFPDNAVDSVRISRSASDPDILYVYTQAQIVATGDGAQLWTYRISTGTWTRIGGSGLNGSWNAIDQNRLLHEACEDAGHVYIGLGGGTINQSQVWQGTPAVAPTAWTQIGGNGLNGSWAVGTKQFCRTAVLRGILYAGLGGTTAGDAEAWHWNGTVWTKFAGDGLGFTGLTRALFLANFRNLILVPTGSTGAGDAEVWAYDADNGHASIGQIAGDGIGGSWVGKTGAQVPWLDPYVSGQGYFGVGTTAGLGEGWTGLFSGAANTHFQRRRATGFWRPPE